MDTAQTLVRAVTHDLVNPLGALRGLVKLVLAEQYAGPLSSKQKALLMTADRACVKMLDMVADISDAVKLESGAKRPAKADTDLRQAAECALDFVKAEAGEKQLQIVLDAPADLPPLAADAELLRRLFTNLLLSAIQFSPAGGRVDVALARDPGRLTARIEDAGDPVSATQLARLFDKVPGPGASRRAGYRLAVCKCIVESHGGKIAAGRGPGDAGCRVQFWLPAGGPAAPFPQKI